MLALESVAASRAGRIDMPDNPPTTAEEPAGEMDEITRADGPGLSPEQPSSAEFGISIIKLYDLIADREEKRPEGSYTTYLFNSGLDKILKKIAEESGEVIVAAKNESQAQLVSELADLLYHLLVLMVERDVRLNDVQDELARRASQLPGGTDSGDSGTRPKG